MEDKKLLGYCSNRAQLYTIRRVTVDEGRARGTQVIEVSTAGGLQLDILPDAGLDIGQVRFKGVNMTWISKNGPDSPAAISPYENEFLNTFPGGLVYTCGMRTTGPAGRDNGEWQTMHGRQHSLAAEQVSAQEEGGVIIVKGIIRETQLFGHVLETRRTIRIPVFGSAVSVEDVVSNLTPRDEEIMKVYHCNFGYPMLSEKAQLILPEDRETVPRTEFAKTGLGRECTFDPPTDNEEERVFFHHLKGDWNAELRNPELGICAHMTWSGDTLPILVQWRSMASGDYALGLEPTNSYMNGRAGERENGTLPVLKAWESITHRVEIEFSTLA